MSVDIGIIGLTQSGKTTIFNALTHGNADTLHSAPHIGVAKVPEPRLKPLTDMLHPKRVVQAEVKYIDIGASVKGMAKDLAISGQLLNQLSQVDALINVVRAFSSENIPHPEGSVDVERDIASIDLELAFSDLAILERKLQKLEISLKAAKPAERQSLLREQALLKRLNAELEKETPIRELTLTPDETRSIVGYPFLSAKPLLIAVNIGEEQLPQSEALEAGLIQSHKRANRDLTSICGELESELSQLEDAEAEVFRTEWGITEPGTERILKKSFQLLGLISFFSIASEEIRAWPVPKGTAAVKAAGKIHSDMERGFIRAEVISFNDLTKCGGLAEARKKGLLRLEGKNYSIQDGDVITFLFNV